MPGAFYSPSDRPSGKLELTDEEGTKTFKYGISHKHFRLNGHVSGTYERVGDKIRLFPTSVGEHCPFKLEELEPIEITVEEHKFRKKGIEYTSIKIPEGENWLNPDFEE